MAPLNADTAAMLGIRAMIVASGLTGGFKDAGFNWWTMNC